MFGQRHSYEQLSLTQQQNLAVNTASHIGKPKTGPSAEHLYWHQSDIMKRAVVKIMSTLNILTKSVWTYWVVNRYISTKFKVVSMFLERKFDAILNNSSTFDVSILFYLLNTSFNGTRLPPNRIVPLLLCFSNDVTDVKRHKRRCNFTVRDFIVW